MRLQRAMIAGAYSTFDDALFSDGVGSESIVSGLGEREPDREPHPTTTKVFPPLLDAFCFPLS